MSPSHLDVVHRPEATARQVVPHQLLRSRRRAEDDRAARGRSDRGAPRRLEEADTVLDDVRLPLELQAVGVERDGHERPVVDVEQVSGLHVADPGGHGSDEGGLPGFERPRVKPPHASLLLRVEGDGEVQEPLTVGKERRPFVRHLVILRIESGHRPRRAARGRDVHQRSLALAEDDLIVHVPRAAREPREGGHRARRPTPGEVDVPQFSAGPKGQPPPVVRP